MDGIYQTNYQSAPKPVATESHSYTDAAVTAAASTAVQPVQQSSETGTTTASPEQIKSAIEVANRKAHFGHTNAKFSYHEATKSISVKIIDDETNEVIKEIPPEETLDMISKMWELAGIMVDEKR